MHACMHTYTCSHLSQAAAAPAKTDLDSGDPGRTKRANISNIYMLVMHI